MPTPRTTPISGVATTAFWFALIGPATLGIGSAVAIVMAVIAGKSTRDGTKGGHFLTVSALFFGITGLLAFLIVAYGYRTFRAYTAPLGQYGMN